MSPLIRRWTFRDREKERELWEKPFWFSVIVISLFALISLVLVIPLTIETGSMSPTLPVAGRVLVSPAAFGKTVWNTRIIPEPSKPQRGDVVLLTPPYYTPDNRIVALVDPLVRFLSFQKLSLTSMGRHSWESRFMLKRIIGVPGDRVRIDDFQAFVQTGDSGFFLSEFETSNHKYDILRGELPDGWGDSRIISSDMDEIVLGEDEYFVLGDNRGESSDSRHWGPVSSDQIIGRAILIYWPFSLFGKI